VVAGKKTSLGNAARFFGNEVVQRGAKMADVFWAWITTPVPGTSNVRENGQCLAIGMCIQKRKSIGSRWFRPVVEM